MSIADLIKIIVIFGSVTISYGTESRTRIALLDTGYPSPEFVEPIRNYLCEDKHKDLTDSTLEDNHGHGTNLIYILSKYINPKKACITVIKTYSLVPYRTVYEQGIKYAVDIGAKYINMSAGGVAKIPKEDREILRAISLGIHFVTVAGNNGSDLSLFCDYYPACYGYKSKYFHVVGSLTLSYSRSASSSYNGPVNAWEVGVNHCEWANRCMSGTSQAAAVFTGKLVQKELR